MSQRGSVGAEGRGTGAGGRGASGGRPGQPPKGVSRAVSRSLGPQPPWRRAGGGGGGGKEEGSRPRAVLWKRRVVRCERVWGRGPGRAGLAGVGLAARQREVVAGGRDWLSPGLFAEIVLGS